MTDWCAAVLRPHARQQRAHPHVVRRDRGAAGSRGLDVRGAELRRNDSHRLRAPASVDGASPSDDGDIPTCVAMLMSSMFGDAISRDVMPNGFPQPESDAPAKYVRVFMRALGVTQRASPQTGRALRHRRLIAGSHRVHPSSTDHDSFASTARSGSSASRRSARARRAHAQPAPQQPTQPPARPFVCPSTTRCASRRRRARRSSRARRRDARHGSALPGAQPVFSAAERHGRVYQDAQVAVLRAWRAAPAADTSTVVTPTTPVVVRAVHRGHGHAGGARRGARAGGDLSVRGGQRRVRPEQDELRRHEPVGARPQLLAEPLHRRTHRRAERRGRRAASLGEHRSRRRSARRCRSTSRRRTTTRCSPTNS